MKKLLKETKGITLIALVVTIIVLIILAVISVNLVFNDRGIISQAERAKDKTKEANVKEQIGIEVVGSYDTDGKINITKLNENLGCLEGIKHNGLSLVDNPLTSLPATVELDGLKVVINGNGSTNIEVAENGNPGNTDDIDTTAVTIEKVEIPIQSGIENKSTFTLNITLSNVTENDYPITLEYYKKLASEADSTYEKVATNTLTEGTTDSCLYSGLSYNSSYMFKVKVTDKSGNLVTVEKTAGTSCFLSGTQVLTEDGMKNIEDIKIGDKVYSMNLDTNRKELKEVIDLFKGATDETYELTINGIIIKTTPKHQFYVIDKGWSRAYELKEGDRLSSQVSENVEISKIEHKFHKEPIQVYNLTVDGYHNYLITGQEILVHNATSSLQWGIID